MTTHPEATESRKAQFCHACRTVKFARVTRYVRGTALTRQKTPHFVCNDCLWESQGQSDKSLKESLDRMRGQLRDKGFSEAQLREVGL
jgi:hypothetical protein